MIKKKFHFQKRVAEVSLFLVFTFKKLWGCNLLISKETRQLVSVCTKKNFWLDSIQAHTLMKTTAESWSSIKQGPLSQSLWEPSIHRVPLPPPQLFLTVSPFALVSWRGLLLILGWHYFSESSCWSVS